MKLILKMSLALLLVFAVPAPAQYIGSSRPLGRSQTLDSLAAKADTQAVRVLQQRADSDSTRIDTLEQRSIVDSIRLDSVAVASAAADTLLESKAEADSGYLHTRIDSVRDNAGGGGGADGFVKWWDLSIGPAADEMSYDWEITSLADSTEFTDSLNVAIDSLSALAVLNSDGYASLFVAPGTYIVCDTVWGPPTGDAYNQITISGVRGTKTATRFNLSAGPDTVYGTTGRFRSENAVSKVWRDVAFENMLIYADDDYAGGFMAVDTLTACYHDSVYFNNMKFQNFDHSVSSSYTVGIFTPLERASLSYAIWNDPATGQAYIFNDCHFNHVFSVISVTREIEFNRCFFDGLTKTQILAAYDGPSLTSRSTLSTRLTVNDCIFKCTGASSQYYAGMFHIDDSQILTVRNSDFYNISNFYYGLLGLFHTTSVAEFIGCRIIDGGGAEQSLASTQVGSVVRYIGCSFEKLPVLIVNGTVAGCIFSDSSYVQATAAGQITGNHFYGPASYGVYISGGSNSLVGGNTGYGTFATWFQDSGTGTDTYDNHDN